MDIHTQTMIMLLRDAKKMIAQAQETFVCLAINRAANESSEPGVQAAADMLTDNIMVGLAAAGCETCTVDSWLRKTVPEYQAWFENCKDRSAVDVFAYPEYIREMRKYRLRWIDTMIESLKRAK